VKKDSKLCNFRLTMPTVAILEGLAKTWGCSRTEVVARLVTSAGQKVAMAQRLRDNRKPLLKPGERK
jgi:hypothetical protein